MELAYQAYLIFSGDNTATIAGNIVTVDDEGTLQVTGTGKTFAGSIGSSTYQLELINIDVATTFNGAVYTTDLEVDGAITSTSSLSVSEISAINADVTTTGTQTYTGAVTLNADVILTTTDNNISFGSTINSLDTTYRDLSLVTGSGNVSVTGIIGADDKLDVLTVNNTGTLTLSAATTVNTLTLTHTGGTTIGGTLTATTINLTDTTDAADITFNGNVSATTLNTAAEGYNVIFNGTTSTITNLVTFSNSGSVTFGNGTGDTTTFTGGVTATAPSQVNLAGTIQTTNNTMSLGDAGTPIVLTANTILSGNTAGAITLGGTVNGGYSLTVNTTGTTTLSGDIGGNTALTTLTTNTGGTTVISVDIETSSTQTYNDAVTINGTLDFTGSTVQFANTLAGDDGTGDNLTISGALDLDGAATSLTSLTVEGTSNLGADVTTSGTQTYSGAVVLSNDVTLTTTDSNITFAVTVDGDGTARDLTIDMDNSGVGADGTVQFANTVGANDDLDVIDITGNLNLDAAISNTTSLSVSGTSNLGANVTTSSTQTYTSAVTLSGGDRILTGTIINFGSTLAGGTNALTITGNVDLDGAATDLSTLSVSGTSNLGADVTTSGTQTYTGDVTISADISLNTSDGDVTFDGDINTADTSSSESGVLQFLGGGSYKYSTDNGSTYSTGTATSSATTLGTGSLTYSAGSYTWTTPDGASATKLLVVGGGGGAGGGYVGAGGGAGGYVYNASYSIDASTNYIVTVGAGGAGGGFQVIGSNGSSSYFGDVEAYGGGGGGTYSGKVPPACPVNGCGSSGGAGWNVSDANIRAASSQGNIGTGPQSSSHGCTGTTCNGNSGGAGGGAGGAGQKHTTAVALTANANVPSGYYSTTPTGGIGLANDITGTSTYYAGGGGSGSDGLGGNGGLGGGGNGGSGSAAPSGFQFTHGLDGEANTGGGGGGGGGSTGGLTGGDGGSGIVVVNYDYDASVYASYNLTISTGSGAVDINGAVANIGTLSITSNSTSSEASGIISTDTIITKAGSGTLLLSANNTYTGQTNINAGIISITDNNSLGSADGATIVADGASLSISNDITSAENITISGTGISSNGAIRNTADDNTLTGLITLGATVKFKLILVLL